MEAKQVIEVHYAAGATGEGCIPAAFGSCRQNVGVLIVVAAVYPAANGE